MSAEPKKKPGWVVWQLPMKRVLYALVPAVLASVYFFGWRSLLLLAIVNAAAFFTELAFTRLKKEAVSSAVFVTGVLFALSLPPTLPVWMAVVGIVFAVAIGKMAFGGFGRNVYNPALAGRVFLYVSFTVFMNARWVEPLPSAAGPLQWPLPPGGLLRFSADVVTQATPLGLEAAGRPVELLRLLWGNVSGCLGETSALLLVLGGVYILLKKAANWRIVASELGAFLALQTILWVGGVRNAADPLTALLSGGFLLGAFFMATDPVSAAQTDGGRWIYGTMVGLLTVLIRLFSAWPEGTMFAILLGNTFAPIIDYAIRQLRSKAKAAGAYP